MFEAELDDPHLGPFSSPLSVSDDMLDPTESEEKEVEEKDLEADEELGHLYPTDDTEKDLSDGFGVGMDSEEY